MVRMTVIIYHPWGYYSYVKYFFCFLPLFPLILFRFTLKKYSTIQKFNFFISPLNKGERKRLPPVKQPEVNIFHYNSRVVFIGGVNLKGPKVNFNFD